MVKGEHMGLFGSIVLSLHGPESMPNGNPRPLILEATVNICLSKEPLTVDRGALLL